MAEEDSFIREVNEELREERIRKAWRRYGPVIIGLAMAVVLATAAFQFSSWWNSRKADEIGDNFMAALELADRGEQTAALAKLDEVEKSGFGGYPALAALRKASLLSGDGDIAGALAAFDAVAADGHAPQGIRDIAAVRAAYLLVDSGSLADVEKRVQGLDTDVDPMRMPAREVLGLAAWKAGKLDEAAAHFSKNRDDPAPVSTGYVERARMMLDLINVQHEQVQK